MIQCLYRSQQIWPHFTPKEVATSMSRLFKMEQYLFFKSTIYYTGLVGRPRWNSIIDVTWRTVDKGQIYQRAHWFLVMMLIDHYRHLRFVDLPVINGNSLMAVACIYWHHRHPYTTCYLNCLFYFSVVLCCSRVMQGRLICYLSWNFKHSVFCNGCHILSLISVDRNVICSLTLGWANCGSICSLCSLRPIFSRCHSSRQRWPWRSSH